MSNSGREIELSWVMNESGGECVGEVVYAEVCRRKAGAPWPLNGGIE